MEEPQRIAGDAITVLKAEMEKVKSRLDKVESGVAFLHHGVGVPPELPDAKE